MQEAGLHAVVRGLLRKAMGTLLPFIHTPLPIQGRAASDRANLLSNAALIFSKTKVKKQNKTIFENRSLFWPERLPGQNPPAQPKSLQPEWQLSFPCRKYPLRILTEETGFELIYLCFSFRTS